MRDLTGCGLTLRPAVPAPVRPPGRHPPRGPVHQPGTPDPQRRRRLSGPPLHIAATLLGHLNLDTTRGYTAVFPEEVIAAHQHFIEQRRTTRPFAEQRTATGEEWAEFENHFLLRKVALGECHRPL